MPIFILLSTLTQQGVQTLKSNPERLRQVNKDVEELGCQVLHQWATLGEFDFVNVVEAPDIATVAKVSVSLGARGSTRIETLPALEIEDFLARSNSPKVQLSEARRAGVETHCCVRDPRIDEYARLLVERSRRRPARLAGAVRGNHSRPAADRGGDRADRPARRVPDPAAAVRADRRAVRPRGATRACSASRRRSSGSIWEEVDAVITIYGPEDAHEGSDLSEERQAALAADDRAAPRADDGDGDPVGDRRVPDAGARGRGRDDARRVRGVHLRRGAARLGRRGRAYARDRGRSSTPRTRCASRRPAPT